MTQDYQPIEITESTPEPTEDGIYLITSPKTGEAVIALDHVSDRTFSWSDFETSDHWEVMREDNIGFAIQSLAAHDAQIRAEAHVKALELTDYELEMLEDARSNSDEWAFGKDIEALKIGIEAVAKYRKEQE